MTPTERKQKVAELRKEHQPYFNSIGDKDTLFIPKMAYRPSGKDELIISFFPSELEKGKDIYTEFVSKQYESEDPKRTLYLSKFNPHWKEEYEMVTSNAGFERHIIPVSELKVINDVVTRGQKFTTQSFQEAQKTFNNIKLPDPETGRDMLDVLKGIEKALIGIQKTLYNSLNK